MFKKIFVISNIMFLLVSNCFVQASQNSVRPPVVQQLYNGDRQSQNMIPDTYLNLAGYVCCFLAAGSGCIYSYNTCPCITVCLTGAAGAIACEKNVCKGMQ